MKFIKGLILSAVIVCLSGCDSMGGFSFFNWGNSHSSYGPQDQSVNVPAGCTHRAAYNAGVKDAKAKRQMDNNYGNQCPFDQSTLRLSYRQGFENGNMAKLQHAQVKHPRWYSEGQSGPRNTHNNYAVIDDADTGPVEKTKLNPYDPTKWQCFADGDGAKVCGYYCQRDGKRVQCTDSKNKRCVKNDKGDMACGYNCTATAKSVKCGFAPEQKCLSDAFGNIQCGEQCYRDNGQVRCE